jgi:hypothetical protein
MNRVLSIGCGALCGWCGVAALDATLSAGLPVLGNFLSLQLYLLGLIVGAGLGRLRPSRWWLRLTAISAVIGAAATVVMLSLTPPWHSKIGWRNCGLVAGPLWARSPYPVKTPSCGILSMCANESSWDMRPALAAAGCPPP